MKYNAGHAAGKIIVEQLDGRDIGLVVVAVAKLDPHLGLRHFLVEHVNPVLAGGGNLEKLVGWRRFQGFLPASVLLEDRLDFLQWQGAGVSDGVPVGQQTFDPAVQVVQR